MPARSASVAAWRRSPPTMPRAERTDVVALPLSPVCLARILNDLGFLGLWRSRGPGINLANGHRSVAAGLWPNVHRLVNAPARAIDYSHEEWVLQGSHGPRGAS